jgi:DNA-binding NarL/FixJ family response regulator
MSAAALAYKESHALDAEVFDLDERLWDHVRIARTAVERRRGSRTAPAPASAVRVRTAAGESVVVVLVDRQAPARTPNPAEICERFNLTARECDVALLLAERLSCREIASRLNMSFHTARCHTEKILLKLGVRSKHDVRKRLGVRP